MVYISPPAPVLLTSYYDVRTSQNAIEAVVRAGADVVQGARRASRQRAARQRHGSGGHSGVFSPRKRWRGRAGTSERDPITDEQQADYLMEVRMDRFGINAKADEAAYLFTYSEAVLLDRRTGREIWNMRVHGRDRLTPYVRSSNGIPGSVITASTLGSVSVAEFQGALNQLMDLSSNVITNELRAALRDVRNK